MCVVFVWRMSAELLPRSTTNHRCQIARGSHPKLVSARPHPIFKLWCSGLRFIVCVCVAAHTHTFNLFSVRGRTSSDSINNCDVCLCSCGEVHSSYHHKYSRTHIPRMCVLYLRSRSIKAHMGIHAARSVIVYTHTHICSRYLHLRTRALTQSLCMFYVLVCVFGHVCMAVCLCLCVCTVAPTVPFSVCIVMYYKWQTSVIERTTDR